MPLESADLEDWITRTGHSLVETAKQLEVYHQWSRERFLAFAAASGLADEPELFSQLLPERVEAHSLETTLKLWGETRRSSETDLSLRIFGTALHSFFKNRYQDIQANQQEVTIQVELLPRKQPLQEAPHAGPDD